MMVYAENNWRAGIETMLRISVRKVGCSRIMD
jgi:hypothetical protein